MVKLNKIGKIWIGILMLLWVQSLTAGGRNQLLVGGSKNLPVDNTQATFSTEKPSLFLGYYHGIDSEWSAILSLHFRNFYNKTTEQSFSLFSADQAILYKLHLHEAVNQNANLVRITQCNFTAGTQQGREMVFIPCPKL